MADAWLDDPQNPIFDMGPPDWGPIATIRDVLPHTYQGAAPAFLARALSAAALHLCIKQLVFASPSTQFRFQAIFQSKAAPFSNLLVLPPGSISPQEADDMLVVPCPTKV